LDKRSSDEEEKSFTSLIPDLDAGNLEEKMTNFHFHFMHDPTKLLGAAYTNIAINC
jgi:hypothetical protein